MDNMKAAQFVFEQNRFRIGELFWLATCNDGMTAPDALVEAIEEGKIGEAFSELNDIPLYDGDEMLGWLADYEKFGFLARVETPNPRTVYEDGSWSYEGGMYTTKWVYAETLDELLEKAAKVSNNYFEERLRKLREDPKRANNIMRDKR